jgi:hypothetical protein
MPRPAVPSFAIVRQGSLNGRLAGREGRFEFEWESWTISNMFWIESSKADRRLDGADTERDFKKEASARSRAPPRGILDSGP